MAQQRHSTEIEVTLNDANVQQAITKMVKGFDDATTAVTNTFKQATAGAQKATQQAQQARQRDERGRFLPRGAPPTPPTPPPTPLTALDRLAGGAPVTGLDALASQGRAREQAGIARARALAEQFTPEASAFRRGAGAFGRGALTTAGVLAPAMLTGDASSMMRAGGALGGNAMGALGMTRIARGLPVVGDLLGALVSRRTQRLGQVAGREQLQTELTLGGAQNLGRARRAFTSYGLSAEQGLGILRSVQRGLGVRTPLLESRNIRGISESLARATLRGVDPSAITQFLSGGVIGGGARGTLGSSITRLRDIQGMGGEMGLTGGGITRLLSAIAMNTQRLASEGLTVDERSFAELIRGVDIEAGRVGARQIQGLGAVTAVQRLAGGIGGVAGGFAGQFGGIGRGALLSAAARQGGSPLDVLRRLEQFRGDPASALDALRELGLGEDTAQLALVGLGLSTPQAGVLMGAGRAELEGRLPDQRGVMRRGMQFSRMLQGQRERLISTVAQDPASARTILSINEKLEKFALSMTESNGLVANALNNLEPAITAVTGAVDGMGEMISDLGGVIRDLKDWLD